MSFRPHSRCALLAVVVCALAPAVFASPAFAATQTYEAGFAVTDTGVWDTDAGSNLPTDIFRDNWNEGPDTAGGIAIWDTPLGAAEFGGSITGTTSGSLGLGFAYSTQGGKLDINYPTAVDVGYPDDASFYPGDTITLTTAQGERAGRSLDFEPGAQNFNINGEIGVKASASAVACVFDCTSPFALFPAIDVPAVKGAIIDLNSPAGQYSVVTQGSVKDVDVKLQTLKPDLTLDTNTAARMYATDQKLMLESSLDVDALSKYPFGKSTPSSFPGGSASYDIIDGKIHFDGWQDHEFDFQPVVKVSFSFPQDLAWVERTNAGVLVSQGTSATAKITVGNKLELAIPTTLTAPFQLTPTLSIDNTLQHTFKHVYQTHGEVKVLQASAAIGETVLFPGTPEIEITPGFCLPVVGCADAVVIPAVAKISVGPWGATLGPVYAHSVPIATQRPTLFDKKWTVPFASLTQAAKGLDPENIPVADAGGPYTVAEGASIDLNATASFDLDNDAMTYAWSLDAAGTLGASGSTPTFAGLDGPHTYTATVVVCDPSGDCSSDTAAVAVTNVDPDLTLDTTRTVVFGTGTAFLESVGVTTGHAASAFDAGTDDTTYDFSSGAFATWSAARQAFFNDGVAPDAAFSPFGTLPWNTAATTSVTYSQPGAYELRLTTTDDDAGSDSATATVLVADSGNVRRPGGWFKQQYSLHGNVVLTDAQGAGYLSFVRTGSIIFTEQVELTTDADAAMVLAPGGTDRTLATSALLEAWLNVASGAVAYTAPLPAKLQGPGRETVGHAIQQIEASLANPATSKAELTAARQLAQALQLV